MKKNVCEKCGLKRGRRQCLKLRNSFICGDCCSSMQLNSACPKECINYGKVNNKDLKTKVSNLVSAAGDLKGRKAMEAVRLLDKAIELDENNYNCYVEKGLILESMGSFEEAVRSYEKAGSINPSDDITYKIARVYRKYGKFKQCLELLEGIQSSLSGAEAEYLISECYFLTGQFENAIEYLEKVKAGHNIPKEALNNARIMLGKIYISLRSYEKAMENALSMDDEYRDERNKLVESIYFASGRMYELMELIDSSPESSSWEKYMLLQCALVLKKNNQGGIIGIVDDLLNSDFCLQNKYEEIKMAGLKIKLLFKDLKVKDAYEIFQSFQSGILDLSKQNTDCAESTILMAYFLYNIDKQKSVELYKTVMDMEIDAFVIDELYSAFNTLTITPFVKAKAIEKSLELMKSGKGDSFNRTGIVADILFEYGEYSQAYDFYKIFSMDEKPDKIILYKIALCLVKQNKFDEALNAYTDVLALTKFIPGIYPGIIRCCLETNKEWNEYFRMLEMEKLSFSEIYDLAGVLMDREYYDKAGYLYNFILEKYKNMDIYSRKMVYHNMVWVYRNLKDYKKALDIIREIPEKYQGELLEVDQGCLYYDIGEYQNAEGILEKIKGYSENPEVFFNLGIINVKLQNLPRAEEYFKMSIEKLIDGVKKKRNDNFREYSASLIKLYNNYSLCLLKLNKPEAALLVVEKALEIEKSQRTLDITFMIQQRLLGKDKGLDYNEIDKYFDDCISIKGSFTEDIRGLLDTILNKLYPKETSVIRSIDEMTNNVTSFIRNERRIYYKYKESYERSEGTFQRYMDNLFSSFEKKVVSQICEEAAITSEGARKSIALQEYSNTLMGFGDKLFKEFEFTQTEEYVYASLIPYFKAIKMLAVDIIYPYYIKSLGNMPVPVEAQEFKEIGIYSYKASGGTCFRIDFPFNISGCEYLFEINCHPGLRNKYLDFNKHNMPWNKLLWIISGIKKKWNVLDDIKSVGLLLLFYGCYKNYLGIQGSFKNTDELINLAGNLIHLSNERDYCIRNMLNGAYEFDYSDYAGNVRDLAKKCMEGLMKIDRLE